VRVLVVGRGLVGRACAAALLARGHAVETASARAVMEGQPGPAADHAVFAQGKPVTVRNFAAAWDDLLASRTGPLAAAAPGTAAILISSTVACLPSPAGARDLPALQRAYEAAFLERFPDGSILRVGAMRGPGWQIDEGLAPLNRTMLLKRLRMRGSTDIPWADDELLSHALSVAVDATVPMRAIVAYPSGFDVNAFLDAGLGPMRVRLPVHDPWFRTAYELQGAPPAFLAITTADLHVPGWSRVDACT